MTTRALVNATTGALVSVGTVLAVNLPAGLAVLALSAEDAAALLTGRGGWDPTTRTVTPRDYGQDRVDLAALGAVVLADPTMLAQAQARILTAKGVTDGAAWVQPEGAHDAYPVGASVTYGGRAWTNTLAANVWRPGVTGWTEVAQGPAAWVQPLGAQDAYALGAVVTHAGKTWTSTTAGNVWEPGVYGWSQNP